MTKLKELSDSMKSEYNMRCSACEARYKKGLKRYPHCQRELVLVKEYEHVDDDVRES